MKTLGRVPLCWPFLSLFPSTSFWMPRSPSPSLAGRLARDTAVIVFLMALDVPELIVTAEFFPHEWIWEILAVSAACVKCSTGHIMVIKGVGVRSTEVCRCYICSSWSAGAESHGVHAHRKLTRTETKLYT